MPFVCGCRNLGEALRRIAEGAAMIRTKGEAGTGDIVSRRYKIGEVGAHDGEVTDLTNNNTQRLPLIMQ